MTRGGYIRQISPGVYAYMPFLLRTLDKISQIIRKEISAIGYEELLMPVLQPKDLWVESGRWERYTDVGGAMFSFRDRRGSVACLGLGYEEVVTDLIRREVSSYKQLPKKLFQIQTKFRDEIRPRFGLVRAREFLMMDAYSFDVDDTGLDTSYQAMHDVYHHVCKRIGLTYRCVEADPGGTGGSDCRDFLVLAEVGNAFVYCDTCEYAAAQDWATSRLEAFPLDKEQKTMEAVYGPGLIGVEPLAKFLGIPIWKTTKTLLYQAEGKVVAVIVRGECDVNETKVKSFLKCHEIALATPGVVKEVTGADVGYAGPVGLPPEVMVLADHDTKNRINFECGANKTDYHNINVNFGRDFPLPTFGDFKLAKEDHLCPHCESGKLKEARGIEIGHIMKLGKQYSEKLNCTYLDREGKPQFAVLGYYGMSVSKVAAALIEQSHDDSGIIWPLPIAPFQVHLVAINTEDEEVRNEAENVYRQLTGEGVEVLFDDRDLRAGEKFGEADLLGMPIRLTISKRTIKERKLELKFRNKSETKLLPYGDVIRILKDHSS